MVAKNESTINQTAYLVTTNEVADIVGAQPKDVPPEVRVVFEFGSLAVGPLRVRVANGAKVLLHQRVSANKHEEKRNRHQYFVVASHHRLDEVRDRVREKIRGNVANGELLVSLEINVVPRE